MQVLAQCVIYRGARFEMDWKSVRREVARWLTLLLGRQPRAREWGAGEPGGATFATDWFLAWVRVN